jgi:hypothetical protein
LDHEHFLPGVPVSHILDRLAKAGGNEIESGKLASPESSAALAVNTFGWFVERPDCLPPFPGLVAVFPAKLVDVEYCARFPWAGGRHPWLDAVIKAGSHLIGVESKRFEPFRDKKTVSLAAAYDRPVWGDHMTPYEQMRDELRSGAQRFHYLDAAQLVKHAFGLVTDGARKGKQPVLVYLFAEPAHLHGKPIASKDFTRHREEILRFSNLVAGAAVKFYALSYREWLETWPVDGPIAAHCMYPCASGRLSLNSLLEIAVRRVAR